MTDDPSTNSGEWVCKYVLADVTDDACTPDRPHVHFDCGYPAIPSPVLDSERPDVAMLRLVEQGIVTGHNAQRAVKVAADWIEAADAHRCPTPERDDLSEEAEAIKSLRMSMTTTAKDMALDRMDAWCYGIVLGWCSCDDPQEADALPEVAVRHGWSDAEAARNHRLHHALGRLLDQEGGN